MSSSDGVPILSWHNLSPDRIRIHALMTPGVALAELDQEDVKLFHSLMRAAANTPGTESSWTMARQVILHGFAAVKKQ